MNESTDRTTLARDAILNDLKERRKAGDSTVTPMNPDDEHRWHKPQHNYFVGSGVMDCPVCGTGKLKYSRAGYNGHVHAKCTSRDCVTWME